MIPDFVSLQLFQDYAYLRVTQFTNVSMLQVLIQFHCIIKEQTILLFINNLM